MGSKGGPYKVIEDINITLSFINACDFLIS